MIFEFFIAYRHTDATEIIGVVRDCLAKVLVDNLNEFDSEVVKRMVAPRIERAGEETIDGNGNVSRRILFGFSLDLPEETGAIRKVVDGFIEALNETGPI